MPGTSKLRIFFLAAALGWMAIVNAVMLWNTRFQIQHGYGDFASFYTAGTQVRRGLGTDLYNHAAQWRVQQEFAAGVTIRQSPLPYVRPPFEALLFSLFAAWPYPMALLLWTILKLALLVAIPFIVVRDTVRDRVRGRRWNEPIPLWAVGLLALGTFPEFMDLLMGQDAPLLAFLFAIAYWQLDTHGDALAGFILGLALFKFQLVIPFVIALLIAGRKRVLPGFAMAAIVVLTVSERIVGWKGLLQYPRDLMALNHTGNGLITPENQMNLRGLLILFVGRVPYPGPIHWVLAPLAIGAIVYAGLLWRKAGDNFLPEGFGLAMIAAIITSYYAYEYDLLSLMVPLLAILARSANAFPTDRITRYLAATGLLLLVMPLYWFTRVYLKAEFLMTLPLLCVGIALARRLHQAGARMVAGQPKSVLQIP
jgi:hypothetical protein